MGGYVALALARLHPELVRALVLADTKASADSPEQRQAREAQQERVRREGVAGLRAELATKLVAPVRLGDQAFMGRLSSMMRASPAGFVAALEAMKKRPDSTPLLGTLRVPALVVVGEEDGITPPAVASDMAKAIPEARLQVLQGAGHLANLERSGSFNEALASFLDEVYAHGGFTKKHSEVR
jgi:3-oxoadipate enol-lactonase